MSDLILEERSDTPAAAAAAARTSGRDAGHRGLELAERFGLLVLFLLVLAVFSILHPDVFATADNARVIVSSSAVVAVVGLALMVPLVAGGFDLSVGSVAVVSSIAVASASWEHGWPLGLACVLALVIGLVIGVINGLLVARLHIDGLIATLATAFILGGLISLYTDDLTITTTGESPLSTIGSDNLAGIPIIALLAGLMAVIVWYVLSHTPVGRKLTAIGSNREAAHLVGVRVDRLVFGSYVTSAVIAAGAGILLLAQQGSANPAHEGLLLVIPALAAVFLGASAFTPGRFNVLGMIVGLLLVASFVSGLTLSGAEPWVERVFEGSALLIAVGASTAFRRRRLGS